MSGYVNFKRMGSPPIPVVEIRFVASVQGREVGNGIIPIPGELGFATHYAAEFARTTVARRFRGVKGIEITLQTFLFSSQN